MNNTVKVLAIAALVACGVTVGVVLRDVSAPSQPPAERAGASGNKTCTTTAVSVSATTSTVVLATSTARRSVNIVLENATSTYVKRGAAVTTSTGLALTALGASWSWDEDHDPYNGVVTSISANGTTTLKVEQCT